MFDSLTFLFKAMSRIWLCGSINSSWVKITLALHICELNVILSWRLSKSSCYAFIGTTWKKKKHFFASGTKHYSHDYSPSTAFIQFTVTFSSDINYSWWSLESRFDIDSKRLLEKIVAMPSSLLWWRIMINSVWKVWSLLSIDRKFNSTGKTHSLLPLKLNENFMLALITLV